MCSSAPTFFDATFCGVTALRTDAGEDEAESAPLLPSNSWTPESVISCKNALRRGPTDCQNLSCLLLASFLNGESRLARHPHK